MRQYSNLRLAGAFRPLNKRKARSSTSSEILNKIKNDAHEVEFYESVKGGIEYNIREFNQALKDPRINRSEQVREMAKDQVHELEKSRRMLEDRIKSERKEMSDMATLSSVVGVAAKTYGAISSAVDGEFKTKKEFKHEQKIEKAAE